MPHPKFQRATPDDLDRLIELIREFYQIDDHDYDRRCVRDALPALLESDDLGVVWKVASPAEGYAVVTWGYSLESGGRDFYGRIGFTEDDSIWMSLWL